MLDELFAWEWSALPPAFASTDLQRVASERIWSHGDAACWNRILSSLPEACVAKAEFGDCVTIDPDMGSTTKEALRAALLGLRPWRKGPFRLGDICIDAEWRSDIKWARLGRIEAMFSGLIKGARVLDVGSGNGYYGWRMLAAGAHQVVGIDHNPLCSVQHLALQRYQREPGNLVFPLALQELPDTWRDFDVVFSMGVASHSRNPSEHLDGLFARLRTGGLLVFESLIVGTGSGELRPDGRYARMRNIWRLPGAQTVRAWLAEAGFADIRLIDISWTTPDEQRSSEWMMFDSLAESLDPLDNRRTLEGWPAPRRALLVARTPHRSDGSHNSYNSYNSHRSDGSDRSDGSYNSHRSHI